MENSEISKWSKALLIKTSVIKGWSLPEDGNLIVLIDQFQKQLIEKFSNTTPEEFEYAMRSDDLVRDWGRPVSLSLIDQVMIPYLSKRFKASEVELKAVERKMPEKMPVIEISDPELVKSAFDTYKLTRLHELISPRAYDILKEEGKIAMTKDEKIEFTNQVWVQIVARRKEDSEYDSEWAKCPVPEERLKNECKKKAAAIYFNTLIINASDKSKVAEYTGNVEKS